MTSAPLRAALIVIAAALLSTDGLAQRGDADITRVRRLAHPQPAPVSPPASDLRRADLLAGERPTIMLTGYWTPSNEMLRRFSDDPVQNPTGWIGEDWEGRGYDVYAYFPEFTPGCATCLQGMGDLEVDYQDTSNDFWPLADAIKPLAIITFSRGADDTSWEVEMNQYNKNIWSNDYSAPFFPTPNPPDASVPVDHLRLSSLPVQEIVDGAQPGGYGLSNAVQLDFLP